MNQTVYSTSTAQANMRRTGCAGMLRVAGASRSTEESPNPDSLGAGYPEESQ